MVQIYNSLGKSLLRKWCFNGRFGSLTPVYSKCLSTPATLVENRNSNRSFKGARAVYMLNLDKHVYHSAAEWPRTHACSLLAPPPIPPPHPTYPSTHPKNKRKEKEKHDIPRRNNWKMLHRFLNCSIWLKRLFFFLIDKRLVPNITRRRTQRAKE